MSIIHEALKKVQAKLGQAPIDNMPVEVLPSPAGQKSTIAPQEGINWTALIFAILVIGACAVYISGQVKEHMPAISEWVTFNVFKAKISTGPVAKPVTKKPQDIKPLARLTLNTSPTTATTTDATIPVPTPLTLNINGVMANGNTNIALINNQVYQEGDEVHGVKIVHISMNEIVVLNNGKEETIKVGK